MEMGVSGGKREEGGEREKLQGKGVSKCEGMHPTWPWRAVRVRGEGKFLSPSLIYMETDSSQVSGKENGCQIIKGHLASMKRFICLFNDCERAFLVIS